MKSKRQKIFLIIGVVIGVFLLSIAGYGFYLYHSVSSTAAHVYKPLDGVTSDPLSKLSSSKLSSKKNLTKVAASSNGIAPNAINILLLGVDERAGDKGRSDTMIVASLNPEKKSMMLTSIPRDTRVKIAGHSGYSKINAAYSYGNESLAVQTVEKYLNIPISYYIKVNMEGLSSLVNAFGGVTVKNDLDFTQNNFHYKIGTLHLTGAEALAYSRMRYDDPQGDFGRNERQREVIESLLDEGKSITTVPKINKLLGVVGNNVKTNLTLNDMKKLATNYRQCRQSITNYEVQGTPKYLDGVSWVLVSNSEFNHVHQMILNSLKG
ncbi:LCP family protein [Pullulanibacillus sp. KACC 23026]|uniref:LCP family glycopolymer transferase n=1 Tax=Pullulanibacillus sp. KACC 23026 TaxID=3028315 RepID=UPI0023AEBA16|nr:LCP family protein [Pullulanibacillus sp. KACC 23026]WEG11493.1 LCP family protein [Pullulanibacillus sp. KACC 23026]